MTVMSIADEHRQQLSVAHVLAQLLRDGVGFEELPAMRWHLQGGIHLLCTPPISLPDAEKVLAVRAWADHLSTDVRVNCIRNGAGERHRADATMISHETKAIVKICISASVDA